MSSTLRVLVIDDGNDRTRELPALLEQCRWDRPLHVEVAGAAQVAGGTGARTRYDVVFARLGTESPCRSHAINELRAAGIEGPVIFVADGVGHAEAAVEAVRRGADTCLFHPVSIDRVARAVREAIQRAPAGAESPRLAFQKPDNLLSMIYDNCDGMLVLDERGIIRFVNPAAQSLLNRPSAELLGQPFGHPVSACDSAEIDLVYDGKPRTVEMRVAQITWEGAAARLAAIRDVTARKRAEEALVRFNAELELRVAERTAQLEAASRAKDQFLAVLSHELRTPLAPVLLTVGALEREFAASASVSASAREDLQTIRHHVELEARLIDDLLDLSRVARGKLQLSLQPTDVAPCVMRAIETCRADAEHNGVRLSADVPAHETRVLADPTRLQQVFWNLLKNAVKFTPRGGTIRVHCPKPRDGWLTVEVRDTGIGMEPHVLSRIFDPFEQGDPAITRQFGGLGLGLAISKAIVDLHHGRLVARSDGEGRGSTFLVELPVVLEQAVTDVERSRPESVTERGAMTSRPARLLLIEDHSSTRRIMVRLLAGMGHDVRSAATGAEAEALVGGQAFDLVISDLGLPDCTGHELLRKLRADGKHLRAIALSGYGRDEDIERSLSVGFLAHLTKPVDISKLQATIEESLRTPVC